MRKVLFVLGAVVPALLFGPASASAQNYPWCAEYSVRGGGTNCGFVTYRQCMETVSGIGGVCYRNPFYWGRQPRRPSPYWE